MNRIITSEFVMFLKSHYKLDWDGIHGVKHWARVRAIGLKLAKETGANPIVVELFAFLHDSCRLSNGHDHAHGMRAADLATSINGQYFRIENPDLELVSATLLL